MENTRSLVLGFAFGFGLFALACGSSDGASGDNSDGGTSSTKTTSDGQGGSTGDSTQQEVGGTVAESGGGSATSLTRTSSGTRATGGAPTSVASSGTLTGTGGATTSTVSSSNGGTCDKFSFFVTSLVAIRRESGSQNGFGGDLKGLTGADELCRKIAETSLSCAGQKTWKAFLSTSTEDAIDRIGSGPWYDRKGRLVANQISELQQERPASADTAIKNDLPNEDGVPNHSPDGTKVDNHDTLTGSNNEGRLYKATSTCGDWTSTTYSQGKPRVGHSWPGGPSRNWVSAMDAEGCAAGVNLSDSMGGGGSCVGCGGGYGGFYCFATTP